MKIQPGIFFKNTNSYVPNRVNSGVEFNAAQREVKNQEMYGVLSDEQKTYLRENYRLEDLTFAYDRPGNSDGTPEMDAYRNSTSDKFMEDLLDMSLITEEEYDEYLNPTFWAKKPLNYDSLPDDMKKGIFKDDPLISLSHPNELSHTLERNVSGLNLLEAFQTLSIQQKRSAALALGVRDREVYAKEAARYDRLGALLSDIFR